MSPVRETSPITTPKYRETTAKKSWTWLLGTFTLYPMNLPHQKVKSVLEQAEEQLRHVIAEAARAGDYAGVDQAKRAAEEIQSILRANALPARSPESESPQAPSSKRHSNRIPRKNKGAGYPKFAVRNGVMYKIGWSKKRRSEYHHRVDLRPFQAVVNTISDLYSESRGTVILAEQIAAKTSDDDEAVPTYQVYLVLAALRHHGLIKRHGREGYTVESQDLRAAAKTMWDGLTRRA